MVDTKESSCNLLKKHKSLIILLFQLIEVIIKKDESKDKEEKKKDADKPKETKRKKPSLQERFKKDLQEKKKKFTQLSYYRNNMAYFLTVIVWMLLQIFFSLLQTLVLYPNLRWFLVIARICGILINFNMCIIILLVLRRLNTWLRNSYIGRKFLVLDESLSFHKFLGYYLLFLGFVHTIGHMINLCKLERYFLFTI